MARPKPRIVAVGEAMIEFAPAGNGLWRQGMAGDTLNTAWHIRQALPASVDVAYVTALGTDATSQAMIAAISASGIDAGAILRRPDRLPGLYVVTAQGEDRRFAYWRDRSAARLLAEDPGELVRALHGAQLVYFSGVTLAILSPSARATFLDCVAECGAVVAFDPNIRPSLWEGPEALRAGVTQGAGAAQIVLPSFDDEARVFGDADPDATIARYGRAGALVVAVKDGPQPVRWAAGDRRGAVPVRAHRAVTDATGAGDAFNGGFLAGLLSGRTVADAVADGIRTANATLDHPGALPADAFDARREKGPAASAAGP